MIILERLEKFFLKFKDVKMDDFFAAPFKIYPHDERFELKFFISQKAIYTYNLWKMSTASKEHENTLNTNEHDIIDEKSIDSLEELL